MTKHTEHCDLCEKERITDFDLNTPIPINISNAVWDLERKGQLADGEYEKYMLAENNYVPKLKNKGV
tara:strand:+ start:3258 stop:3458 length:201 start_codon:yes stop_codon:yes gene_type:complete